jgi:hypothetical protein
MQKLQLNKGTLKSQKEKKKEWMPQCTSSHRSCLLSFLMEKKKRAQNSLKAYREHNYKAMTMTA